MCNQQEIFKRFGNLDSYETSYNEAIKKRGQFPSLNFYFKNIFGPVIWLCYKAMLNQWSTATWLRASAWVADIVEETGGIIEISGMDYIRNCEKPCIFVANHMSVLETFILPAIIRPYKPMTYVIKQSLMDIPCFKHVMRHLDPICVKRENPREDLSLILEGGAKRLKHGISLVVFPQSTRSNTFDRTHFNSIGIKLAIKNNVPIIPLSLKTDFWGIGKKIKEAGKINPNLPVRFKFSQSIYPSGNGKIEHKMICDFIELNLNKWQKEDGVNNER